MFYGGALVDFFMQESGKIDTAVHIFAIILKELHRYRKKGLLDYLICDVFNV